MGFGWFLEVSEARGKVYSVPGIKAPERDGVRVRWRDLSGPIVKEEDPVTSGLEQVGRGFEEDLLGGVNGDGGPFVGDNMGQVKDG